MAHQRGKPAVFIAALLRRTGNDQRRARLVDQNIVHLIDNRIVQFTLHQLREIPRHIVAQVVEPELVVRSIGNISKVGFAPRTGTPVNQTSIVGVRFWIDIIRIVDRRIFVRNCGDAQTEQMVDRSHPSCADFCQVVVDRDQMAPLAGQRIQIERQSRHQRFPFAGLHLGDLALVQHNAAYQLHVVVALTDSAARRLTHDGKRFGKQIIKRFAVGETLLEFVGFGAQFSVGERLDRWLEAVDPPHDRLDLLDCAIRTKAE
jgi:hypothetical protein